MERKTVNLKDFTMSDEGSGFLEGYPSVFGSVDSTGDIIVPGAYADTIPDFLSRGFTAQGHDWSFGGLTGYPVEAKEDGHGLFAKMAFHSTPDAQNARTVAKERAAAGKEVPLSIGFEAQEFEHIEAKDYATKLPQYVAPDQLESVLAYSAKFPKLRALKKIRLYEFSLVSAPAQRAAQAVSVKAESTNEIWDGAEEAASVSVISRLNDRLMWYLVYDTLYDEDASVDEKMASLRTGFQGFQDTALRIVEAILRSGGDAVEAEAKSLRELWCDPDVADYAANRREFKFMQGLEVTVAAASKITSHAASKKDVRRKEGRHLSVATVEHLRTLQSQLNELLAGSEIKAAPTNEKPVFNPLLAEAEMALLEMQMQEQKIALLGL
jgi:HK97 family phage prohead protease